MKTAARIENLLALTRHAVAVKFQSAIPEEIDRIESSAVSGCTYWKLAAAGATFYTVAEDHYGCPIGAHTHGIDLPEETAKELEGLVGTMVDLHYIEMSEVPGIPQLESPFGVAVYAPVEQASFDPDVVLVSGSAKQMMILGEATHAAGITSNATVAGRPTCAAIPAVVKSGEVVTNLGCIGNRVYTEIGDDELYFVIPGSLVNRVAEKLEQIVKANDALSDFHRARVAS